MTYEPPNYTQTPNQFFDETLAQTHSMSELKVVLAVIRQTFGWHKIEDRITLDKFQEITGLSRQAVLDGLDAATKHGIIIARRVGTRTICYRLLVREETKVSLQDRPTDSLGNRPKLVYGVDAQKKGKINIKETEKRNRFLSGKYADDIKH